MKYTFRSEAPPEVMWRPIPEEGALLRCPLCREILTVPASPDNYVFTGWTLTHLANGAHTFKAMQG